MKNETLGLILGGALPALVFSITGIMQKVCSRQGVAPGYYLLFAGIGVLITGFAFLFLQPLHTVSVRSALSSAVVGITWSLAMGFIYIALSRYSADLSLIAPIYSLNILFTVIGALIIFSEFKEVNSVKLLIGAGFTLIGCVLVATS